MSKGWSIDVERGETRAAQSVLSSSHGGSVFFSGEALYRGKDMGTVEAALASEQSSATSVFIGCLAVLFLDVLTIPTAQLPATTSLLTVVDGEVIFADAMLTSPSQLAMSGWLKSCLEGNDRFWRQSRPSTEFAHR